MSTYASGAAQPNINLASFAGIGVNTNVVLVPWTGITAGIGGLYTIELGTPFDGNGDAASDWSIIPQTPGTLSSRITSPSRTGVAWWCSSCLQSGPEPTPRRAFLSAFEWRPSQFPVGITGCASGFQGNNDRAETTIFYAGLKPGVGLSFRIAWNGVTPLTFNSGLVMILSS
jgi:hypothetical protein